MIVSSVELFVIHVLERRPYIWSRKVKKYVYDVIVEPKPESEAKDASRFWKMGADDELSTPGCGPLPDMVTFELPEKSLRDQQMLCYL